MEIKLRQEQEKDHEEVENLIQQAFAEMPESDHSEHELVARLRHSEAFVPELSMVAESGGKIIGHILLTRAKIQSEEATIESLALAPVSVHPDWQRKGIGGLLILEAHRVARQMGYGSVTVLGHADYYPRFGYQKTSHFGLKLPFEVPEEVCMAIELRPGALQGASGVVEYASEFFSEG